MICFKVQFFGLGLIEFRELKFWFCSVGLGWSVVVERFEALALWLRSRGL